MNSAIMLFDACNILFGPLNKHCPDTLKYIQLSEIKSAYREKSKLFHPDRSKAVGKDEDELEKDFKDLNKAYNILLEYKKSKINIKNRWKSADVDKNFKNKKDFYYKGKMPKRELRFGEFLYYSGKISWNTLISSIVKQYNLRGKIGRICINKKYISENDVSKILANNKENEKFGETALKIGCLSINQLNVALREQKSKQYPIGRYFIENKIISTSELKKLLDGNRRHNVNIRIKRN